MQVGLRPTLTPAYGTLADWWSGGARDGAWWAVWYESYRSFILTQARLAAEAGATTLILGGPEVTPSLPGGLLSDGTPSIAPADADARWRALISAEMIFGAVAARGGLGWFLHTRRVFMDTAGLFAGILVVMIVGSAVENGLFGTLERRTIGRWGGTAG